MGLILEENGIAYFPNRRKTMEEKLEIGGRLTEKYALAPRTSAPAETRTGVIRPLADFCRHCTQRPPLGKSPYCARCIELNAQEEVKRHENRDVPNLGRILLVAVLVYLIYLAFQGWLDLPANNFQRPVSKSISSGN